MCDPSQLTEVVFVMGGPLHHIRIAFSVQCDFEILNRYILPDKTLHCEHIAMLLGRDILVYPSYPKTSIAAKKKEHVQFSIELTNMKATKSSDT